MSSRKVATCLLAGALLLVPGAAILYAGTDSIVAEATMMPESYFEVNKDGVLKRYNGPSGDVVIPETVGGVRVTSIGDYVFDEENIRKNTGINNWEGITSVVIPEGVTSIGDSAFEFCLDLTSVVIPSSVTSIGFQAFGYCRSLSNVEISDGVTSIGDSAFTDCTSLTSVEIPNSVTSIGEKAFGYYFDYNYDDFQYVNLVISGVPGSEAEFYANNNGFEFRQLVSEDSNENGDNGINDESEFEVDKDGVLTKYNGPGGDVVIPEGVKEIGRYAFDNCNSLKEISIPDSVTSIGPFAFENCAGLEQVVIPDGVECISPSAFAGCISLKSISIPDTVTDICENAFSRCWSMTSIKIPDSVKFIGDYAFEGCLGLKSINIPEGVTIIDDYVFFGCENLESIEIPDGVTIIDRYAFGGCRNLKSVTLPDSLLKIETNAFNRCSSLENITIPNGVWYIGESSFSGCGFTSITIPNSVTSIPIAFGTGYKYDEEEGIEDYFPIDGFTIYGVAGSEAEYYAKSFELNFVAIEEEPEEEKPTEEEPADEEPIEEEPDDNSNEKSDTKFSFKSFWNWLKGLFGWE